MSGIVKQMDEARTPISDCNHFWSANPGTQECLHCHATRQAPSPKALARELKDKVAKRISDYQPPAATVLDWLYANLGGRALAPLTGSDTKALRASVQIMEQYGYDRHPSLIDAFALVVFRMQPKTRELAYHAIAHPLDWSDRHKIWMAAGLPAFAPSMKCSFEPGGSYVDHSKEDDEHES